MRIKNTNNYKITKLAGLTDEQLHDLSHELCFGQFGKEAYTMDEHGRWGRMQGQLMIWQDRGYDMVHSKLHRSTMPLYVQCTQCGKAYNANQSMWQIRHYHTHLLSEKQ